MVEGVGAFVVMREDGTDGAADFQRVLMVGNKGRGEYILNSPWFLVSSALNFSPRLEACRVSTRSRYPTHLESLPLQNPLMCVSCLSCL